MECASAGARSFACRQFLKRGCGTLINIASELGSHTVPYYSSYAAAKHGVVGLGDCLRQEIAPARRLARRGWNRGTDPISTV